jgi:hypothetical protein
MDVFLLVAFPSPRQTAEPDQASPKQQERTRRRRDEHPNAAQGADAVGGSSEAAAKGHEDFA